MNNYICYELEQLEKITGYSLVHIKNDINNVYNSLEEKDKEIERLNNIIYREISNYILKKYGMLDDTHYHDFLNELELKESGNNE